MDNFSWAQFGLGAVIIGAFFVPATLKLYNDLKAARETIVELQEKRLTDSKEMTNTLLAPMREFNSTGQALIQVVTTHGKEK